jgi:hypothetical protein
VAVIVRYQCELVRESAAFSMAHSTDVVDVERLLVSCGYSAATARCIRSGNEAWRGPRLVSRAEAIAKLTAHLASKPRKHLVQVQGAHVLAALKGEEAEAKGHETTEDQGVVDAALAKALASLACVARSEASMRMSPDNLPSLIDMVAIITGASASRAAKITRTIIHKYFSEDYNNSPKMTYISISGWHQKKTPFPKTLEVLVEFVLLIPGRKAAALRQKAASLIVRYYGGDERMIDELLEHRRAQVRLDEEEPENPQRVFGQAIDAAASEEASSSSGAVFAPVTPDEESGSSAEARPPPPFRRTRVVTDFKGTTDEDLYVMELTPKATGCERVGDDDCLYKIGKSKEVEVRRHDLALDFSQNYWVSTLLILKRCGDLEQSFHRRLQEYRRDVPRHRNGKELSKSREVFDLKKWAGKGSGEVVTTLLVELAEDIVASLDSPTRSLRSQDEAEPKRRRCVDLELEREKTLQKLIEAEVRKAEAEAEARKAEARKAEAEAEARKAEAEARKAEVRARQLELLVNFDADVQATLARQWHQA